MKNKADILNELKELSVVLLQLKETERLPVVPGKYFNELTSAVLKKIEVLEELKNISPVLSGIKMDEAKPAVPKNYFEHLELSSLHQIEKENAGIPAGYFETFADHILSRIKEEEKVISKGKLVALPREKKTIIRMFSRIAIAASFIGIIIFGVKDYHQTVAPVTVNDCEDGVACLTQDEIYNYMHAHSHEFSMQQVQETVSPVINKTETKIIDKTEASHYIEQHKNVLDVDDAATDIF